jgi:hypothetical protein
MRRVIREVITLIRIERWLVKDDQPMQANDEPGLSEMAAPPPDTEIAWTLLDHDLGHVEEASAVQALQAEQTEQAAIFPPDGVYPPDDVFPPDGMRVLAQRLVDVRQWEIKHKQG